MRGDALAPVAIVKFDMQAFGKNRDETLAYLDRVAAEIIDTIGGVPWMVVNDDIEKVQVPPGQNTLRDDQGFAYHCQRTVVFQGPLMDGSLPVHEGYATQKGAEL